MTNTDRHDSADDEDEQDNPDTQTSSTLTDSGTSPYFEKRPNDEMLCHTDRNERKRNSNRHYPVKRPDMAQSAVIAL
jgi:hypothetical protein